MRQIIVFFVIHIVVFGCTRNTETQDKNVTTLDNGIDSLNPKGETTSLHVTNEMVEIGDSLLLPTFEIQVTLSDSAQKKMTDDHESIIVKVYLSGQPKDSADVELTELGELFLGTPQIELNKPGIARFDKINISKKAYESLVDKDFEILINIYSGRRSSENNILDAELLQGPVSDVTGKRHVLNAKLIRE
jgi:hypothetical protein